MGNWKSHENDNAYPDPLTQLLLKLLLTANVDVPTNVGVLCE